jgi:hypothetical protein
MKSNSSSYSLSILVAVLLSAVTAFGQTNTTGTNWVVTITAPDPSASEAGDPGLFNVSRGTNTTGDLLVFLSITGTALNGVDYQAISNRVLIADGAASTNITIIPIDDAIPEPTETIVVRVILAPAGFVPYRIGAPNIATNTIADNDGFVETNHPPAVTISQPSTNATFLAPTNIFIRAFAQDSDGFITSVEFFANNQSLGFGTTSNTASPFFFLTWSNVPPGAYDLTAKATDDDGAMGISLPVHIFVGTNQPPPPTNRPPVVNIVQPTNNAFFFPPATIPIRAFAQDFDGTLVSVEFFANNQSLGLGRSSNPGSTSSNLFFLTWSNVPPGAYDLTAKSTDDDGAMGISSPVHIFVGTNQPPPPTNHPPVVNIIQPTNTAFFFAPANIFIRAFAQDFDGFVTSVEFFANNQSLGLGRSTNSAGTTSSLFFLTWSNVPSGAYDLTAKATDDDGAMRISSPVHIFVGTNQPSPPTNHPPLVRLILPLDGSRFAAPATIGFAAEAQDFDPFNFVFRVEFFANGTNIGRGVRSNTGATWQSNQWYFSWSNVVAGDYVLAAKATDNFGAMAFSEPVHVSVVSTNPSPPPPTNGLAVVNITAPDPTGSEGLVMWCSNTVLGVNWWWGTNVNWLTNWPCPTGTNTATFVVRRSGETNQSLRVFYSIGGSASNGVDYESLSGVVTIPAGARAARIVVRPIDDTLREGIETVVLRLRLPLDPADTPYAIGLRGSAAAYITDNEVLPPPCGLLADGTVHLCLPFTNQCFRVELSTNLVNWEGICTNRLADGAAHLLDPDAANCLRRFFRFIPVPCPPDDE